MTSIFETIPTSDKLLRQAVFIGFGGKCFYTGREVSSTEMHIDHIRPKSKGGKDCIANYVLSCQEINLRKSDRHSDKFEEVCVGVVELLFAGKVASILDDLRLNGDFVRPNDWLRGIGVKEGSREWNRLRHAIKSRGLQGVYRIAEGKSRGIVLYSRDDLDAVAGSCLGVS